MTTKLTVEEVWNDTPPGMNTSLLYNQFSDGTRRALTCWFSRIVKAITTEKDTEIARLKARIAELELERAATISLPKPRITAGEKLSDVLLAHGVSSTGWKSRHEENKRALQAAATDPLIGLTDDPEPPSDGLLLKRACEKHRHPDDRCEASNWGLAAAEFRRSLAERDGVQREND